MAPFRRRQDSNLSRMSFASARETSSSTQGPVLVPSPPKRGSRTIRASIDVDGRRMQDDGHDDGACARGTGRFPTTFRDHVHPWRACGSDVVAWTVERFVDVRCWCVPRSCVVAQRRGPSCTWIVASDAWHRVASSTTVASARRKLAWVSDGVPIDLVPTCRRPGSRSSDVPCALPRRTRCGTACIWYVGWRRRCVGIGRRACATLRWRRSPPWSGRDVQGVHSSLVDALPASFSRLAGRGTSTSSTGHVAYGSIERETIPSQPEK